MAGEQPCAEMLPGNSSKQAWLRGDASELDADNVEDEDEEDLDAETLADLHADREYTLHAAAQHASRPELFHFLPENHRIVNYADRRYKWFRGPERELEHYWVHMTKATMRGRQAVVAGMEVMFEWRKKR